MLLLTICSHFRNIIVVTNGYYIVANTSTQESKISSIQEKPVARSDGFFFFCLNNYCNLVFFIILLNSIDLNKTIFIYNLNLVGEKSGNLP
jgi:hypothetical protein